jgi:hypothetical protein
MRFKNLAVAVTLSLGLATLAVVLFSVPAGPTRAQAGEGVSQRQPPVEETVILSDAAALAGIHVPDAGSRRRAPAQASPATDFLSSLQKEDLSLERERSPSGLTAVAADAMINGDFEEAPLGVGWLEYSSNGWPLILTDTVLLTPPRSGRHAVWLGGDFTETSIIQQTVVVPPPADAELGYWVWIGSEDICQALPEDWYDWGGVAVYPGGSTTPVFMDAFQLCEGENTGQWVKREVDLSAYAGQVLPLQVLAVCDASLNSNLFIDDVRLGLPEVGDHTVFLPLVLRLAGGGPAPYALPCSVSNGYCEPFNTWSTAYGRLQPGVEYRAYPNDNNDYYYFTIEHTTSLTLRVTNYIATGQVLVRRQDLSEVAKDFNVPPGADGVMEVLLPNLPAGKYYVQVFTSGGQQQSSRYTLKVQ